MTLFFDKASEQLKSEWNYNMNLDLDIHSVSIGYSKKVWWKCKKGHQWEATISHRIRGTNCPICSGHKILVGYNDLHSQNPVLAEEWDHNKNGELTPQMVTCKSNKKVWWKCSKCSHSWMSTVSDRTRGQGCPLCANQKRGESRRIPPKGESFQDKSPELLMEWNYEKNGNLLPSMIYPSSNRVVWWKCSEGHEWKASLNNRSNGTGCPYCSGKAVLAGYNDLETKYPIIAHEWNNEKNVGLTPQMVTGGCNKRVWWKCKKGHEWKTSINSRTSANLKCPYCSDQKILIGYNDLQTKYPEIIKEWDYKKNKKAPYEYPSGSKASVWWICKKGHEWTSRINNRTILKRGCPICAKELRTSFPEQAIYYYVKKHFPDAINDDRNTLNGVELDIFIPSMKFAIEYDGLAWHNSDSDIKREQKKNTKCMKRGITLLRVREKGLDSYDNCICISRQNNASDDDLNSVIIQILTSLGISNPNINIERDRIEIHNSIELMEKENSLEQVYPDIASTWNYEKNGRITPAMVSCHSNKRVWWKCEKGHEWMVSINNRIRVLECPICSNNRLLEGYNDLLTKYPDLAKEWDYEKNAPITPDKIRFNENKKYWWKCEYGHSWETMPYNRYSGNKTGCPICAIIRNGEKKATPSMNESLSDLYPEIASEWNYEKNESLLPTMVKSKSTKKVWWKCKKGHEWQAKIQNRTSLGRGCPYCYGRYVIPGKTDLATTNPTLASEWNYDKNEDLQPSMVLPFIAKKVWWKCKKGHEWQATINSRSNGCGCPYCAGRKKRS